jgi:benzoyl-CoA-dihydrodiol lyase
MSKQATADGPSGPQAGEAIAEDLIDFRIHPARYRHWQLRIEPPLAFLTLEVDEQAGLRPGYQLKQNSYDLGVDFELYDATQRLRFEHPEVRAVVLRSDRDRIFCAGANIGMLGASSHQLKVNFCKFTNETRLAIEDACQHSGQSYLCAVRGTAAGGGYELALACDRILLADDGSSAVSLPEVPLLGVLPGTGGLTRLLDKRHVRRDRADLFCTLEEGVKGRRAVEWNLVDELLPRSSFEDGAKARALELAASSDRPGTAGGADWPEVEPKLEADSLAYSTLRIEFDRGLGAARLTVLGPTAPPPGDAPEALAGSAAFWPLVLARELDDALLHLRLNETRTGQLVIESEGELGAVAAFDAFLHRERGHWFVREVLLYWKRVLKRLDLTARSVFTLIAPGSCFAGLLLELPLASDRSYMFEGESEDGAPPPSIELGELNFGAFPTPNGLSRLETRFLGREDAIDSLRGLIGTPLEAADAEEAGLVTEVLDDLDWEDEVRIALEERSSFSPDALTALEANLRFPGPETLESKIFGRLSAWQNWIFQRPNAVGEEGALRLYGTGRRPRFDSERI